MFFLFKINFNEMRVICLNDDMSEMFKTFSKMMNNQNNNSNNSNTNSNDNFSTNNNFNSNDNFSDNNSFNSDDDFNSQNNFNSNDNFNSSNNSNFNNINNLFGNIDMNTILKIQQIMNSMNDKQNDSRTNLLLSLKPYLKESRKNKVDQYIQLMKMGKIFEIMNPLGGDSKHV